MELTSLTAISPLDGRYRNKIKELSNLVSEFGLIKARLTIEVEWLIFLAKQPHINGVCQFNDEQVKQLQSLYKNFSLEDASAVKEIEQTTNHDVKAVEYFLKQKLQSIGTYDTHLSFIHFACTSEDINNLSYSLILNNCREQVINQNINILQDKLVCIAKKYASQPMLARTHGQSATPTTMGKELINFADRIQNGINKLNACAITGKFNGATGNYNAHKLAYPAINWPGLAKAFVENLGLKFQAYSTQINPHDDIAEFSHCLIRINNILLDMAKDIWGYISLNYFEQKINANEVGSSTMPHKVNPIDFENAEGNLGLANSLLDFFANKLTQSRWQRDLSDSTVLRNLGNAIGYMIIAYQSLCKGIDKLILNKDLLSAELDNHWELLAEPIQTIMRKHGIQNAYEQLKDLTRGEKLNQNLLYEFINSQPIPKEDKNILLQLSPCEYIGYAEELTMSWSSNK